MAGTLFQNNLSPYLTIVEATEPSAPAAGQQRLYIDSTTHLLKATNSSGTDRTIEGVPAGAITTSGLTQATARLLGRTTASTGAVEEITVGSGLSLAAGALTATAGGFVGFRAYGASPQALSAVTETNITFGTEDYDTSTMFSSPTFTVPGGMTGKWRVTFQIYFPTAPGACYARLHLNGSSFITGVGIVLDEAASSLAQATGTILLTAADTLVVRAYRTTAGDVGGGTGYSANAFEAQFMGA